MSLRNIRPCRPFRSGTLRYRRFPGGHGFVLGDGRIGFIGGQGRVNCKVGSSSSVKNFAFCSSTKVLWITTLQAGVGG